ncbi:uncharacterized protein LOC141912990 [Tubulanus polymorphus]|uniref:uncharacterized protein LOC141912990 n=1 Tax=Tubulanus polymorphus TaxID=672921 RepID=UPI003DA5208E
MVIKNDTCRVTHTLRTVPVKPIAICQCIDPTCQNIYAVVETRTFSVSPTITCPGDLVVRSCGIVNRYSHRYTIHRIKPIKSGAKTCVTSAACTHYSQGCRIQAVCVDPISIK